jgi:hypothetical protein
MDSYTYAVDTARLLGASKQMADKGGDRALSITMLNAFKDYIFSPPNKFTDVQRARLTLAFAVGGIELPNGVTILPPPQSATVDDLIEHYTGLIEYLQELRTEQTEGADTEQDPPTAA